MISALQEISFIRSGRHMTINHHNANRYRILLSENDGSNTAYYFSVPLYHDQTHKLVGHRFEKNSDLISLVGSNSVIRIQDQIVMQNSVGFCNLRFNLSKIRFSQQKLEGDSYSLFPTSNGIAIQAFSTLSNPFSFSLIADEAFLPTRTNDRSFCFMKEKYRPLVTLSCVGSLDEQGLISKPAEMRYTKQDEKTYGIEVVPTDGSTVVCFEINMYEPKLWQDTTVESHHPKMNNAFGGAAFIGHSQRYGDQWLYSRLDISKVSELLNVKVKKAVWHIPVLNQHPAAIIAITLPDRFCSFGSTWENKLDGSNRLLKPVMGNRYISFDITNHVSDNITHRWQRTEGFILRGKKDESQVAVIGTGDSSLFSQILEVNFRP